MSRDQHLVLCCCRDVDMTYLKGVFGNGFKDVDEKIKLLAQGLA